MAEVDLNRLRQAVKAAQSTNQDYSSASKNQPVVRRDGTVAFSDDIPATELPQTTKIPMGTFAASAIRQQRDQTFADNHMPTNTEYLDVDGVGGWLYSITTAFGNLYEFFAYHSEGVYKVKVVTPEGVEKRFNVHDAHIFSDGTICFNGNVTVKGLPSLEQAYAKSVLWAHGFDTMTPYGVNSTGHSGKFEFSINND